MAISNLVVDRRAGIVSFRADADEDAIKAVLLKARGSFLRTFLQAEKQNGAGNCGITYEWKGDTAFSTWNTSNGGGSFDMNGTTQNGAARPDIGSAWWRVRVDTLDAAAGYVDVVWQLPLDVIAAVAA